MTGGGGPNIRYFVSFESTHFEAISNAPEVVGLLAVQMIQQLLASNVGVVDVGASHRRGARGVCAIVQFDDEAHGGKVAEDAGRRKQLRS